jgi:putative ABC transport system substrate-binding protein
VARSLGIALLSVPLKRAEELEPAFAGMAQDRANGVVVFPNSITSSNGKQIADLAIKHRMPGVYAASELAEAGGLLSYGPLYADNYRRAAAFVDKVLKGAKPADMPVEQPTKFEMVVNMKTAKTLGITIPNSILVRADKVIE